MISDDLMTSKLKKAAEIAQEREILLLEQEMSSVFPHAFSLKFEKKMKKLLEQSQKSYYYWINTAGKRVAIILVIVLTVISTTVFSIKALRDPVVKFLVEMYEKVSTVTFGAPEDKMKYPSYINQYYEPAYLPNGYTKNKVYKSSILFHIIYSKTNEKDIIYEQNVISTTELKIDTENNANVEKSYVAGYNAIYYANKGIENLIWSNGTYGFKISGTFSKDTMIKIAESLQNK